MEEIDYLKKFYEELILERQENTFEKFLNYCYNYFKRGKGELLLALKRKEYLIVYRYFRAFANNNALKENFENLTNSLVKEPIYNKDYWKLTNGYLNENCPNFYQIMFNIHSLCNAFASFIKKDIKTRDKDTNLKDFLNNSLIVIDDILNGINYDGEMNSYQFAEIVMLKNFKKVFTNILNDVTVEINIIPLN